MASDPTSDRLPPIPPAAWSAAQRDCADEIIRGPRGGILSPFVPLLRSPELCTHAQRMGEYLRYRSSIGQRLSELAILVTARFWDQPVEWAIHAPIAIREGVAESTVSAIGEGRPPPQAAEDERVVIRFLQQTFESRAVDDETWEAARRTLGEQGVVDLMGIAGYYTLLSFVMNGARTPTPLTVPLPLPAR